MNLKNKKVTVVGLGKSGFAAAKFLCAQKALVRVTEGSEKQQALENASYLRTLGVEVETGRHTEGFISGSDWVVTSPGVPKHSSPLEWARHKKIRVISEVELAYRFCRGRIVAVTGSNGKTTTCHMIYRVLTETARDCILCGNVGYSFLDAIPAITSKTIVVLELSSFQLEDSPRLKPYVAVVLNLSPNHLDRHGNLDNYARAKENIFRNQGPKQTLVLNADDERVAAMGKKARSRVMYYSKNSLEEGLYLQGDRILVRKNGVEKPYLKTGAFHLKGTHNLENSMACAAVASVLRVSKRKMQKALNNFKTLEHRIEPLGEVGGVQFVNDSKSTTVQSTRAAILAMDRPLVLIAGGRDKGLPFAEIGPLLPERVKLAVLYGEAREKIAGSWEKFTPVKTEKDFRGAVRLAYEEARPGDCVLLSPMCTSYDQFTTYEQRGETFKQVFAELCRERGGAECKG